MVSRFVLRSTWPTRLVYGRYRGLNKHVVYVLVYREQIGNNKNNGMKYESKLETLAATETDHRVRRLADRPAGVLIVTPVRQGDLRKIWQYLPCSCEAGRINQAETASSSESSGGYHEPGG